MSCDRTSAWDCIQKEGDREIQVVDLKGTVMELELFDDVNLELRNANGEAQSLMLVTGQNMIPEIKFVQEGNILRVSNDNTCRWVRPSNNVTLILATDTLQAIRNHGYGNIISSESLRFSFRLSSFVPGEINLQLENHALGMECYALVNVELSGTTDAIGYYVNKGEDGIIHAENLRARRAEMVHDGYNSVHLNVLEELQVHIRNSGDIYLYNEPDTIIWVENTGPGELIRVF